MTRPAFLDRDPVELKFGTSGLRGLVRDMTDLEVYVNVQGFLRYLSTTNRAAPGSLVLIGRDLRAVDPKSGLESSPRIARAVGRAVLDAGFRALDLGTLPTPAVASFALAGGPDGGSALPAIMVTGSHIPADRNGVKFYQPSGEVLKADEAGILEAVGAVRAEQYGKTAEASPFDAGGSFKTEAEPMPASDEGRRRYVERYVAPFGASEPLAGLTVVVYQHSSVARDVLTQILGALGADVIATGRVDHFVAVDTEDVTVEDEARYRKMVLRYAASALVSTDGDGDRPLVVDDKGRFHRGDELGILCAEQLMATDLAVPVSSTDAIERHLTTPTIERTRIGSPYVIDAMNQAVARGAQRVVGWEANGGFLTATPYALGGREVAPLPTRDAVLPILVALLAACEKGQPLSTLFAAMPARATRAGLLDDFDPQRSKALLAKIDDDVLKRFFGDPLKLGAVTEVNRVDGIRVYFAGGDIVHLRPSGNAPQFRVYTVADTQDRADALVDAAVGEPDGIIRQMERALLSP